MIKTNLLAYGGPLGDLRGDPANLVPAQVRQLGGQGRQLVKQGRQLMEQVLALG